MTSEEAEGTLRGMLSGAGIEVEAVTTADIDRVWDVYEAFAKLPVTDADPIDQDGDMLLAQWGCRPEFAAYDYFNPIGELFYLDLTRQFTFSDEEGEYDHMAQLQCELTLRATDALKAVPDENFWGGGDVDAFFARAKSSPGYAALKALPVQPLTLTIGYSEV